MVTDDMQRVLYYLWSKVMVEARRMTSPAGRYEVGPDDIAMQHATGDDILGWVDDCEARLAFDVSNMRAAAIDYLAARDGVKAGFEDHEVDGVLSQALYEMGGQA